MQPNGKRNRNCYLRGCKWLGNMPRVCRTCRHTKKRSSSRKAVLLAILLDFRVDTHWTPWRFSFGLCHLSYRLGLLTASPHSTIYRRPQRATTWLSGKTSHTQLIQPNTIQQQLSIACEPHTVYFGQRYTGYINGSRVVATTPRCYRADCEFLDTSSG